MNKMMLLVAIYIFQGSLVFANPKVEPTPDEESINCYIFVKYIKDKKSLKTETFSFTKKSEKECRKEIESFGINFAPHLADKKVVTYKWVSEDKK